MLILALAAPVKALPLNAVGDPGFEDPKHALWDSASTVSENAKPAEKPWGDASPYVGAHSGKRAWDFAVGLADDFTTVAARVRQSFAPVPVREITEASVWAKASNVGPNGVRLPPRVLTVAASYTEGEPTVFAAKPPKGWTKLDFLPSLDRKRSLTGIEFSAAGEKGEGTYVAIDDVSVLRTLRLPRRP